MNTKQFRAAVFGEIETWGAANFPTIPIIYENGPVPDEDKIGLIWIDTEVRWYGGQNLGLGALPNVGRYTGTISTQVYYRAAQGTGLVDDVIDSLETLLRSRRIGTSIVQFPQRTVPTHLRGWYKSGLLFPFTLDR